MNLYTIGFSQKSAEEFFTILKKNNIDCLIDVRLNNVSQLAGFTKSKDLKFFLKQIANIDYIHDIRYAPTKDILDNYKKNKISWANYESLYNDLIEKRKIENLFKIHANGYNNICLLCSEPTPQNCHRRLLGEYLKQYFQLNIKHL